MIKIICFWIRPCSLFPALNLAISKCEDPNFHYHKNQSKQRQAKRREKRKREEEETKRKLEDEETLRRLQEEYSEVVYMCVYFAISLLLLTVRELCQNIRFFFYRIYKLVFFMQRHKQDELRLREQMEALEAEKLVSRKGY